MAALYVFPDTNLLLHFQRIDELDWKALCGEKEIVVVLAPAVVKELGKHKDQHPVRKLRQRARNLNSWLRQLRTGDDKRLKNGVTLEVATQEPTAFLAGDLDPAVIDDRIIASALAYIDQHRSVAVATDDTILLHKLDAHGLRAIEVPGAKRLPDEPDELELEARILRKQLAETKLREPALDLVWQATDARRGDVVVGRANLERFTAPAEIARRHPALPTRAERARSQPGGLVPVVPVGLSDAMVEAHNDRLAKFHRNYAAYYANVQSIADLRRRHVHLALRLKNVGNASAMHIQVLARFPEGLTPLEVQPNFNFPEAPSPPDLPGPFGLAPPMNLNPSMFRPSVGPLFDPSMIYDRFAAEIDPDGRIVRWARDRLPHGPPEDLDALHCVFAESLVGTTVHIEVEIHAEELARPEQFELKLRFTEQA